MFVSHHTLKWTRTCRSHGRHPHAHTAHFLLNRHRSCPLWMPTLRAHGGLADWDGSAFLELGRMSAATMDRCLRKTRDAARPRGVSTIRPAGELLRNSITAPAASNVKHAGAGPQ